MARLFCDGRDVAAVSVADTFVERFRGLLGRDQIDGAMMVTRSSSVHTLGMRFTIDVAFCDRSGFVIDVITMKPHRMSTPRRRAYNIVEASEGCMQKWGIQRGSKLEVRP